jgi:hypothetical protein
MSTMTCDEDRIVAFLHGELSDADEQAFDDHLLTCETCWWAVREDRVARLALERLREPAPLGLADRVALSIDLDGKRALGRDAMRGRHRRALRRSEQVKPAHQGQPADQVKRRSPQRFVVVAALLVAVLGSTLGWALHDQHVSDPPQIAGVVAMMTPKVASSEALRGGEHFDLGGQSLTVRSYEVEGVLALVAMSARPFPMPAGSHLLAGSSSTAWMATHGVFAMYGLNRRAGTSGESMFLVAAMPMAQLPQLAVRLHLI